MGHHSTKTDGHAPAQSSRTARLGDPAVVAPPGRWGWVDPTMRTNCAIGVCVNWVIEHGPTLTDAG
jgi:hypothetical protein